MRRTDQRRAAVFALYQHDLTGRPLDEVFERDAASFTRALAHATSDNAEDIDARIERLAKGWTLDRIAPLERAILRLALLEMLHPDIVESRAADPARGRDRRGRRARQGVLRPRRSRLRQRHPRGRAARGAREWRAPWLSPTAWTRWSSASSAPPPSCAPASSRPSARPRSSTTAPASPPRPAPSSTAGCARRTPGPGVAGPARARVVSTRSRPRAEAAAYPDHLRHAGRGLPGRAALRLGARRRGPRGGDALLAARRRQAHPARARARHRQRDRPRPGVGACRSPPRSS